MKISYKWLQEHVPLEDEEIGVDELCERLTIAGAEVEEYFRLPQPGPLVTGEIKEVQNHPNSDGLSVCTVNTGDGFSEIVCGAPNLFPDRRVPVLLPGGELPGGKRIEEKKVKGVKSEGMICSKEELGLEEKSAGIWIFDIETAPGEDLNEKLEFGDYVIDFELTSNRSDLLSVYGMAREVSALFDLPLSFPDLRVEPDEESAVQIEIENEEDTFRYSGRTLRGVSIGPSPLKIQHRLAKVGFRPKNNIVDTTNYIMLEIGQPLHSFDLNEIRGEKIKTRRAREGESLVTIDGTKRELSEENLLITDEKGPIALAGIMGGTGSEVTDYSQDIFLESACFNQYVIRKSAKKLAMNSEASRRFERGTDREITLKALDRAAKLLQKGGCKASVGTNVDLYPARFRSPRIELRKGKTESLVGAEFSEDEITGALNDLGFSILESNDGKYEVEAPSFRGDVRREVDLIEEIARVRGYDQIESKIPDSGFSDLSRTPKGKAAEEVRKLLTGMGLYEVINSGFYRQGYYDVDYRPVEMENPMGEKRSKLRGDLAADLLSVAETNFQEDVNSVTVFELGKVFRYSEESYQETRHLAALISGRKMENLDGKAVYEFPDLKGILEELMGYFDPSGYQLNPGGPEVLHPTRKAEIRLGEEEAGFIGELHPELREDHAFPYRVYFFELDFHLLTRNMKTEKTIEPLPKYPPSRRDLSLIAPEKEEERRIRDIILKREKVENLYLYDVYRGEQIGEDQKSLTYEVTFRDRDKTLDDEAVNSIVERIKEDLKENGIRLREQ